MNRATPAAILPCFPLHCLRLTELPAPARHRARAALDFIDAGLAGGGAVLVHCFAGVSRSVTVVAAWLMLRSGRADCADAEGALAAVRAARPRAKPNAAFWAMLERLEHTRVDNR